MEMPDMRIAILAYFLLTPQIGECFEVGKNIY